MRLYNGCPGPELKAVWEEQDALSGKLRKVDPDARCTYFPMEESYSVWSNYKQITDMWPTKIQALREAIDILSKEKEQP